MSRAAGNSSNCQHMISYTNITNHLAQDFHYYHYFYFQFQFNLSIFLKLCQIRLGLLEGLREVDAGARLFTGWMPLSANQQCQNGINILQYYYVYYFHLKFHWMQGQQFMHL